MRDPLECVPLEPRRILEVGPGTGAITAEIIKTLHPRDHLTLVEINPAFVSHLRDRFEREPAWRAIAARTEIVQMTLEDFRGARFDRIISGLPLNNFPVATVARILEVFAQLIEPQGVLSFFEYIAIRHFKQVLSGKSERDRLTGVARAINTFLAQREIRRQAIWMNFPPAWAHHARFA